MDEMEVKARGSSDYGEALELLQGRQDPLTALKVIATILLELRRHSANGALCRIKTKHLLIIELR